MADVVIGTGDLPRCRASATWGSPGMARCQPSGTQGRPWWSWRCERPAWPL